MLHSLAALNIGAAIMAEYGADRDMIRLLDIISDCLNTHPSPEPNNGD
jgi:hypothetical protein